MAIFFGRTLTRTAVPQKPKIAVLYGRTVQYARSYTRTQHSVLASNKKNFQKKFWLGQKLPTYVDRTALKGYSLGANHFCSVALPAKSIFSKISNQTLILLHKMPLSVFKSLKKHPAEILINGCHTPLESLQNFGLEG